MVFLSLGAGSSIALLISDLSGQYVIGLHLERVASWTCPKEVT